jgi:hypoxanthine-DNA glycosylase
MRSELLQGLPPLVGAGARCLVLGSFPSASSLAGQCYYGHPRNHFWRILELAWGQTPPPGWPERGEWLLAHGLAVWDVVGACRRQGSLDQAIEEPQPNDIAGLLAAWPAIGRILLNGATAAQLFRRGVLPGLGPDWQMADPCGADPGTAAGCPPAAARLVFCLPSSSPIPTRRHRRAEDKLAAWGAALGTAGGHDGHDGGAAWT